MGDLKAIKYNGGFARAAVVSHVVCAVVREVEASSGVAYWGSGWQLVRCQDCLLGC